MPVPRLVTDRAHKWGENFIFPLYFSSSGATFHRNDFRIKPKELANLPANPNGIQIGLGFNVYVDTIE